MRTLLTSLAVVLALLGGPSFGAGFESLVNLLREKAAAELPKGSGITVSRVSSIQPIPVSGNFKLITLKPSPPLGTVLFELSSPETDGPIYGNATIRATAPIIVARRPITHGEALNESNLKLERREVSALAQSGFYGDMETLNRLQARGYIRGGAILNAGNTETPLSVSSGQLVDLVHRTSRLEVVAKARALQNGRIGDWIRVENTNSKRIMQARVARMGEVETR